jgi:hypothetical protein
MLIESFGDKTIMYKPREVGTMSMLLERQKPTAAFLLTLVVMLSGVWSTRAEAAPVRAPIFGEIQSIAVADPNDHWSNGLIVVGGQRVFIPRNMLLDLPANRLTLQELFTQAPPACVAAGETGLAKTDTCNTSGSGGFATISANITNEGNIIAGDVFIQKGTESISGVVTFINHTAGFFRLNGAPGSATTGVMVRINDPDARHTVQRGPGCQAGSSNCSPDPRFTLDPDNYTNTFTTGYPLCIPSIIGRNFQDVLDLNGNGNTNEILNARGNANGVGDILCPDTNRLSQVANDSRRFAPLKLGDFVTAEGNFETINGVRFLSSHSTTIGVALGTRNAPNQPDYLFLDEVEVDAPGFDNQRVRALIIGYSTLPSDILLWSLHYDPIRNEPHEFPLASTRGCDTVGGAGACTSQGLGGGANNIFKIRYDTDFDATANKKPELNPCSVVAADNRFGAGQICQNPASVGDQLAILSPMPHEIQARTGHGLANPGLITLDIKGQQATNGQYLFPFGVNLGGIGFPEFVEVDLNRIGSADIFEGLPWLLDRRLSPGGCIDTSNPPDGIADCETDPQPLAPFPASDMDPRTQAPNMPTGPYNSSAYTASPLGNVRNRIFSYVTEINANVFNFNGNSTLLDYPPLAPPALPIRRTPALNLTCTVPPPPAANGAPQ